MAPPRPRWEAGSKRQNNKAAKPQKIRAAEPVAEPAKPSIPLKLQQKLLDVFKNSFKDRFEEDVKPLLQEVKGHLYNRDFSTAFGKEEYLEAYAARWSASRALGYAQLFWDLRAELFEDGGEESRVEGEEAPKKKVVCLGGGAGAEVVALGALQKLLLEEDDSENTPATIQAEVVDSADWTNVVDKLEHHVTTAPPVSAYASAAIKAANKPLAEKSSLEVKFHQIDVLNIEESKLVELLQDATVVTIFFTLNELYSASLPSTQLFLLKLTAALQKDAKLIVVDSPGSYSTVTLGGAEKTYPMQWLLDHTLLAQTAAARKEKKEEDPKWAKIEDDESRWFRLDESLNYPIELENMRMQVHLYRHL